MTRVIAGTREEGRREPQTTPLELECWPVGRAKKRGGLGDLDEEELGQIVLAERAGFLLPAGPEAAGSGRSKRRGAAAARGWVFGIGNTTAWRAPEHFKRTPG